MRTIDDELTPTDHPLIGLDARGRPWVRETGTKVMMIAEFFSAVPDMTVGRYCELFPHLSAEQVTAALDYYAANQEVVDEQIRRSTEEAERLRRLNEDTPASRDWRAKMWRLKAEWKRP